MKKKYLFSILISSTLFFAGCCHCKNDGSCNNPSPEIPEKFTAISMTTTVLDINSQPIKYLPSATVIAVKQTTTYPPTVFSFISKDSSAIPTHYYQGNQLPGNYTIVCACNGYLTETKNLQISGSVFEMVLPEFKLTPIK